MTIKLKISSSKLNPKVNYIPFGDDRPFLNPDVKEVKSRSLNKMGIYGSTLGVGMIPNVTKAQTNTSGIGQNVEWLNPQAIFDNVMAIAISALGISVATTITLVIANGIIKQFGSQKRKQKMKEWHTDIWKGFTQCLVAIPAVFALYYLAMSVFGQIDFSNVTFVNTP